MNFYADVTGKWEMVDTLFLTAADIVTGQSPYEDKMQVWFIGRKIASLAYTDTTFDANFAQISCL